MAADWVPPAWFGPDEQSDLMALRNAYKAILAAIKQRAEAAQTDREKFGVRWRLSALRHEAEASEVGLTTLSQIERRQQAREANG